MLIKNHYHTKQYKVWLENGIICASWREDSIITLKLVKEMVKKGLELTDGAIRPVFVDLTGMHVINGDARKYLAGSNAAKYINAGAIYVKEPLQYLAGQVFIYVDEPSLPCKLFTERDSAMRWLELFK